MTIRMTVLLARELLEEILRLQLGQRSQIGEPMLPHRLSHSFTFQRGQRQTTERPYRP